MPEKQLQQGRYQSGVASLFTAIILIIAATLTLLYTAKIAVNQSRTSANEYRTEQALQTALAGIDQGVLAFNEAGQVLDATLMGPVDITALTENCPVAPGAGVAQTNSDTLGIYYFANDSAASPADRCGSGGASDAGTLYAVGWSDDCSAMRQMSVCIGTIGVLADGEGPQQPFVTRASVGFSGSGQIVNRFTNISVWAGGASGVQANAFNTYLRKSGTSKSDYDWNTLTHSDPDEGNSTQVVSNQLSGAGIDVVAGDPSLDAATSDEFWYTFMNNSKATQKYIASTSGCATASLPEQTCLFTFDNYGDIPQNTGGLFWLDKSDVVNDASLPDPDTDPTFTFNSSNAIYGKLSNPPGAPGDDFGLTGIDQDDTMIMIINGNAKITGGTFYGMVYVTGKLEFGGNAKIYGTLISENGPNEHAGGTGTVVYVPMGEGGDDPPSPDSAGVKIPGSWRDW